MSMEDLTPEQIAEVEKYRNAFEQEFQAGLEEGAKKTPLSDIEELKGDFLSALQYVLRHTDNPALKAKVAMWGYDRLLEQGKGSKDALAELLGGVPEPKQTRRSKRQA